MLYEVITVAESIKIEGLDDPKLAEHVPADLLAKLREGVARERPVAREGLDGVVDVVV